MNKGLVIVLIAAAIAIPIAVYAAGPLFINTMIDEPRPVGVASDGMDDKENGGMVDEQDSEAPIDQTGTFVGVGDGIHDATGIAKVLSVGDSKVLRLEEFRSTNGPDLYVYLSTDKEASEYVSLGRLKANIGNQNYDIPDGTDLSKYSTVLIWCQQFSVLFGSAKLESA